MTKRTSRSLIGKYLSRLIGEYLSRRETAEILADPNALRGLAEAKDSEEAGDVLYGADSARSLLARRKC
jgi:hypothetical protein